jgi:hypothetical protein
MTLSPAAQAVLDAAHEAWITKDDAPSIAAAALRAAADQVERRGERGDDWDPGETADWLRAEADRAWEDSK